MTWDFLITALIVVLMPGTGVIYTLAVGLGQGPRQAAIAACGCTLGIVPHMAASILGLAALLHASAVAFQVVKVAGVVFLFWMAWSTWRNGGVLSVDGRREHTPWGKLVRDGILLNLLNPKLSIFFLAFLPQFVPAGSGNATARMAILGVVFMGLTLAVFALYGAFAALARDHVIGRPRVMRWMRGSFAAAFGLLGLRLAVATR